MRTSRLSLFVLAASLLALAGAKPAIAADRVPMQVECSAVRTAWTSAREFTVLYEGGRKVFKDIVVNEKARVFTPTDEKSLYTTRGKKGWGLIITVPNQRDGRWTGKQTDAGEEFTLKAPDGGASFTLGPVAADARQRTLTWQAEMEGPAGEKLTTEGVGSCRVVSTVVDAPPAAEADAPPTPKTDANPTPEADATPAPKANANPDRKTPRKEIRLFGRRKGASTDGGEASQ